MEQTYYVTVTSFALFSALRALDNSVLPEHISRIETAITLVDSNLTLCITEHWKTVDRYEQCVSCDDSEVMLETEDCVEQSLSQDDKDPTTFQE